MMYLKLAIRRRVDLSKRVYRLMVGVALVAILLPLSVFTIKKIADVLGAPPAATARWGLNEAQGTTITDSTGNGKTGTRANAIWAEKDVCLDESCLYFDGTSDYVSRADDDDFDFTGSQSFTFTVWFRRGAISTNPDYLITKYETTGADGGYRIYMNSDGTMTCGIDSNNTSFPEYSVTSTQRYDDNKWHHTGCVKNAGTSLTLYVDGNQVATASIASIDISNNDTFYLGSDTAASTDAWLGFVDEFRLYRQALTGDEIKVDFNFGGAARFKDQPSDFLTEGIIGYWKMDELSGNATDSSGNVITLTNNGTTPYIRGKYGRAPRFNGTSRYFSTATTISGVKSVSFWVNPANVTDNFINLASGVYINSSGGTVSATGFNIPTIYVNGVIASTISASTWQLVTVTTDTSISASAFEVGRANNSYAVNNSQIDDVRLYNRPLTPAEIASLYNWGPGPVGHWKLDEASGTNAYDSSGYGNNGTLQNLPVSFWTLGRYGGAMSFTQAQQGYIDIPDSDSLSFGLGTSDLPFSVAAWSYMTVSLDTAPDIVSKGGSATASTLEWDFYWNWDGSLRVALFDSAGGQQIMRYTTSTFGIKQWLHTAFTYDGTGINGIKIYVNGVQQPTATYTEGSYVAMDNLNVHAVIGAFVPGDTSWQYFGNGITDDVRIYNYARSSQQIVEDMNAGHPTGGSPIGSQVAFFNFDEQFGQTINNKVTSVSLTTVRGTTSGSESSDPTWKTQENCKINGCLDFDGGDDVVTVTNATTIDLNDNLANGLTFSAWINPDTVGELTGGEVFRKSATTFCRLGGSTPFNITCSLDLATDATVTVNSVIPDSTWTHVAMSWTDDADDEITVWINGAARGTSTNGVGPTSAESSNLSIGGGTSNNFDGKIDEFKIYSSELTTEQVKIDMNSGSAISLGGVLGAGEAADISDGAGNPPLAFWNLDENTGTSANDRSGNNITGTLMGPTNWTAGKFGSSVEFNGTNTYITMGNPTLLQFERTNQFSFSVWFRTAYTQSGSVTTKQSAVSPYAGYNIQLGGSNYIFFQLVNNYGSNFIEVRSTNDTGYNDGKWHHLEVTYNGSSSASGVKMYWDGRVLETTTVADSLTQSIATSANFNLGSRNAGEQFFLGQIDEVKIYNYVRTPAQAVYDYNRGAPIAWWKFDDCSGTTAYNNAKNANGDVAGNNGTIYPVSLGNTSATSCTSGSGTDMWYNGATGKRNASLDFDGTDDYVQITDTSSLRFDSASQDYSLFTWVKRDANGEMNIISKEDDDNDGWRMQFNSSNQVVCSVNAIDVTSSSTITDTNWHHVGCTIDRDGNGQVYIDGKADGSATAISSEVMATTSNIRIATRSYTSANYFNGLIDDVRIYAYSLSAAQVRKVVNDGSARFGGQ